MTGLFWQISIGYKCLTFCSLANMCRSTCYWTNFQSESHKRVYRVNECEIIKPESISFLVTWPMGWCQCNTGHYLSNCWHPSFLYMQFDSSYHQTIYVCYFATVSGNMTLIFRNWDFLGMWLNISQLQLCFLQLQLFLAVRLIFYYCVFLSIWLNMSKLYRHGDLSHNCDFISLNCDYLSQLWL